LDITNILKAKEGIEKAMGDVLRILGLYRRLWLSEIYMEIEGMNSTLKESVPSYNDVKNAVRELGDRGYVQVEKGYRGSLLHTNGVEDYLVTLNESTEVIDTLYSDRKLLEYTRIKHSLFKSK